MNTTAWRILTAVAAAVTIGCAALAIGLGTSSEPDRGSGPAAASDTTDPGRTPATSVEADATAAPGTGAPGSSAPPASSAGTVDPGPQAIAIASFAFNPETISVPAGSTITWTNEDEAAHTVDSEDGVIDSDDLEQGDSFEVTLDEPGTIEYICDIHQYMRGSIEVTE